MKTRRILIVLMLLLSGLTVVRAGNNKPVTIEQLPKKAREFINTHFSDLTVSYARTDNELLDKSYGVFFVNGGKIEFDGRGEWKEIDFKYDSVPSGAVPKPISEFIGEKHPGTYVIEIDKDRKDYDVKLNNGLEIKFDHRFKVVSYDD